MSKILNVTNRTTKHAHTHTHIIKMVSNTNLHINTETYMYMFFVVIPVFLLQLTFNILTACDAVHDAQDIIIDALYILLLFTIQITNLKIFPKFHGGKEGEKCIITVWFSVVIFRVRIFEEPILLCWIYDQISK